MNFRNLNYSVRAFLKGMHYHGEGSFFILEKGDKIIFAQPQIFHEVLNHFDEFFALREDKESTSLNLARLDGVIRLEKDGRRMVFKTPYAGEIVMALKNFDLLFQKIPNDGVIDFTEGIPFFGFTIKATPAMILEVDYALLKYNAHYQLKEGDVVFDCGAYVGTYALWASKQVGETGRVFAFEPDPENYDILTENILRNNVANVIPVNAGLWESTGEVSFESGQGVASKIGGDGRKIKVYSLEGFCAERGLVEVDFVKMDVEGAEVKVIEGSREFIRTHSMNFAIASYHITEEDWQTSVLLEPLFRELGYAVQTENPEHLTTYAARELLEK